MITRLKKQHTKNAFMNQLAQMLKIGEEVFSPSRSGFENENGKKVKKKKS